MDLRRGERWSFVGGWLSASETTAAIVLVLIQIATALLVVPLVYVTAAMLVATVAPLLMLERRAPTTPTSSSAAAAPTWQRHELHPRRRAVSCRAGAVAAAVADPGAGLLISVTLTGWLNQRLRLRRAHVSTPTRASCSACAKIGGPRCCCSAAAPPPLAYVPVINLVAPAFAGLAFVHQRRNPSAGTASARHHRARRRVGRRPRRLGMNFGALIIGDEILPPPQRQTPRQADRAARARAASNCRGRATSATTSRASPIRYVRPSPPAMWFQLRRHRRHARRPHARPRARRSAWNSPCTPRPRPRSAPASVPRSPRAPADGGVSGGQRDHPQQLQPHPRLLDPPALLHPGLPVMAWPMVEGCSTRSTPTCTTPKTTSSRR